MGQAAQPARGTRPDRHTPHAAALDDDDARGGERASKVSRRPSAATSGSVAGWAHLSACWADCDDESARKEQKAGEKAISL